MVPAACQPLGMEQAAWNAARALCFLTRHHQAVCGEVQPPACRALECAEASMEAASAALCQVDCGGGNGGGSRGAT